eukprot:11198073-Alexandrium_andersonii.AAC.2
MGWANHATNTAARKVVKLTIARGRVGGVQSFRVAEVARGQSSRQEQDEHTHSKHTASGLQTANYETLQRFHKQHKQHVPEVVLGIPPNTHVHVGTSPNMGGACWDFSQHCRVHVGTSPNMSLHVGHMAQHAPTPSTHMLLFVFHKSVPHSVLHKPLQAHTDIGTGWARLTGPQIESTCSDSRAPQPRTRTCQATDSCASERDAEAS